MIKILIVDDHAIVRKGLMQIIAETEDIDVAGEAETGMEALKMVRESEWDIVLLDLSLPDKHGVDILKQIKSEYPKLPILVLSSYPEDQYALRTIKAGASGYLSKQSAPAQLVTAIRQVAGGRKYVSPILAEQLADALAGDVEQNPHQTLSDREYQTLCMIASGKTISAIAEDLCLSIKTISVYRSRLLEKMRLKNNAELTHYAIKNRLVE
jgi:two-component system, NarL family, invasion response regulator UvrY